MPKYICFIIAQKKLSCTFRTYQKEMDTGLDFRTGPGEKSTPRHLQKTVLLIKSTEGRKHPQKHFKLFMLF